MGRGLTKGKRRSGRSTIKQPSSTKSKRILNPLGNSIIAQNWDKKETASQNYRRLGLVARLKAPAGGVEPRLGSSKKSKSVDRFAIQSTGLTSVIGEARVERDADGKIARILGVNGKGRSNPLNDPLNALDTDSENEIQDDGKTWGGIEDDEDETTEVVKELEAEANRPRPKKIRGQSEREREWLQSLVEKHGDDVKAMARDPKLNPMQQTEADISRRLKKFRGTT